jgi:hypothetical protein
LQRKAKAARIPLIRVLRMLAKEGKTVAEVQAFLDQNL